MQIVMNMGFNILYEKDHVLQAWLTDMIVLMTPDATIGHDILDPASAWVLVIMASLLYSIIEWILHISIIMFISYLGLGFA